MKHSILRNFFLLFSIVAFALSCSKNNEKNTSNQDDVVIAANDNNSLGKYSGVLVGSSGYYTIELREIGSTATVVFNGTTYNLTGVGTLQSGKAVTNFVLIKDNIKVTITVDANGNNPVIKVEIPNHNVFATIFKSTTTSNVENYVGTVYDAWPKIGTTPAGNATSTFNLSIKGNTYVGYRSCISGDCSIFEGTVQAGTGTAKKLSNGDLQVTLDGEIFTFIKSGNTLSLSTNLDGMITNITLTKVN